MPKLLCSKKEAADALGVSVRTIDNLIVNKQLAVRRVGRRVLVPIAELDRFAKRDHLTRASVSPIVGEPGVEAVI